MEKIDNISFSSFLSGFLLKINSVSYLELTNHSFLFENRFDCNILDDGFDKLFDVIIDDGISKIYLKYDYDYLYNGISIKEYLYNLTNSRVREYFKIDELILSNVDNLSINNGRIFNKIKTRFFG